MTGRTDEPKEFGLAKFAILTAGALLLMLAVTLEAQTGPNAPMVSTTILAGGKVTSSTETKGINQPGNLAQLEVRGRGIINDYTHRQNALVRLLQKILVF